MKKFLLLTFFGVCLVPFKVVAQDRAGFIGQGFVVPIQFEPKQGRGNEIYAVDLGYFFTDHWVGNFSWEFALRGPERVNISMGPRYLMRLYSDFKPYAGAEFLYLVDPTNDLGWRAYFGFEYNLQKITDNDNLRVTAQTGMSGISHLGHADDLFYELIRIGISWSY